MSPVDRAGSVSEISPRHSFLYKNFDVHMRRRAGPVTEISVTELEIFRIFPIWTLQPTGMKHFQLRMACGKVADRAERGSTGILVAFWTFFISVTGIKFSIWTEDKICPAHQASLVTGLIWRGPQSGIRKEFYGRIQASLSTRHKWWITELNLQCMLRAIYTIRLCCMRQAYDRPTTQIVLCKSNLQLTYNCCVCHKKCRQL